VRCGLCRHLNPPGEAVCRRCASDLEEQIQVSPWVLPGMRVSGRYEVRRALGAGGMGAVFAGHDQDLGREVALKVVLPTLPPSSGASHP
jgi:serine/threonine protein kinase